jgi:hypothetical protein
MEVERGRFSEGCRVDLPIDQVANRWTHAIEEQLSQE